LQNLLCNEQAAADITEAVHCHVGDWSQAALTSLQRRRIDKIAVVSLDVIFLDHAHFSSPVTQVTFVLSKWFFVANCPNLSDTLSGILTAYEISEIIFVICECFLSLIAVKNIVKVIFIVVW